MLPEVREDKLNMKEEFLPAYEFFKDVFLLIIHKGQWSTYWTMSSVLLSGRSLSGVIVKIN